jgi:nicotinate-nucleotide--dimethylbenzimidazole phosphoribosyltransferase
MTDLEQTLKRIEPVAGEVAAKVQERLDGKTKPRRSLGRLEDLACQIAAIRRTTTPKGGGRAIVIMAGDHGVAEEGVSAYPQEVTGQMLLNFALGGAAINVLARQADARVVVVDMGVRHVPDGLDHKSVRRCPLAPGTANFCHGPAMTRDQAERGLLIGVELAAELAGDGVTLLGIGEMGIANTTATSALASVFTGAPPEQVTGSGTGIDEATRQHKIDVVRRAIAANEPRRDDAVDVLARLGGFEIVGLAGVVLGAAARRIPVLIDGFIASTAALAAVRLCPDVAGYLIASHRSVEPGHRAVLDALGARPLLDLELRLGEGTGGALAMHIVEASLRILDEMATFEGAGVTDSGA